MKGLRIVSLGIVIWGLSLLWPEINLILSPKVMTGLGLALGIAMLIWEFVHHFDWYHPSDGTRNNHCSGSVPPIALARH